jgi:hypothetical protein
MKKITTQFVMAILFAFAIQTVSAQTVIYSDNFDANGFSLPAGWYATPGSWTLDTASGSTGAYTGASGHYNVGVLDVSSRLGADSLISKSISTVGFNMITIEWGNRNSKHFMDSGSTIQAYYSINNGTSWTPLSYIQDSANSQWGIDNGFIPVALPANASNQASVKFMWLANIHHSPSGTYRLDDVTVSGTPYNGVADLAEESFAKVYVANNNIHVSQTSTEIANVEIISLTGQVVHRSTVAASANIAVDGFSAGMYLVKVYNGSQSAMTKIVLK